MARLITSTRRNEITPHEHERLAALTGVALLVEVALPENVSDDGKTVHWVATSDPEVDLPRNRAKWLKLWATVGPTGIIAGDFPHAAIEALATMPDQMRVYVRVYAIGGGYKRDSEFLRWAKISPGK